MPNRTKKSADRISRRTVLRGAGVTMALPWLESLPAFADTTAPAAFPKRFAVLFMGNGVNEDHWSAEGSGADMKLSKTLAPLEPLKHKINVINGLFNKRGHRSGHSSRRRPAACSRARTIQKGADHHAGISVDQMIANHIGQDTAQSEHRAGLRAADDRLSRDQLLDGLQLAHLVAERRTRRCRTKSTRRWPSTTCSRTAAACAT